MPLCNDQYCGYNNHLLDWIGNALHRNLFKEVKNAYSILC